MLSKVEGNTDVVKYSFTGDKNFSNSLTEIINYTPAETTTIKVKGQLKTNCNARFDFVSGAYNLKSITSTTNALVNVNETFGNITPSNGFTIKAIWTSGGTASNAKVTFTPIEILEDLGITIPKDFKRGKPRELKAIGGKASITIFGVDIDNERIADNDSLALSSYLEFCNKKGTNHTQTIAGSSTMQYYTFTGYGTAYGYHTTAGSSGTTLMLEDIGVYVVFYGLIKCKPGDKIRIAGAGTNLQINDFY